MPWRNNYGLQIRSNWGRQNLGSGLMDPKTLGFTSQSGAGGGGSNPGFFGDNTDFGWNANTLSFGMKGLEGLGNLWGAWQSNKLAKDQLNFTKNFARANLANQTQAYNTSIEDRARSRGAVEGQTSAEQAAWVNRNRLPDRGV